MSKYKIKSNKGFYVGDPCYVLNEVYKKIWGNKYDYETSDSEHLVVPKGFEINGNPLEEDIEMLIFSTAYGDGSYKGDNHVTYAVDSGTIGIIPLELIEKSDDLELGSVHGIPGEAVVDYVGGDYDIAFFNTDGKQETSFNICTITCDEDYDEEEP